MLYLSHSKFRYTRFKWIFTNLFVEESVYTFRETASSTDKVPTNFGVTKHALFSIFTLAMSIILAQCLFALAFFGYRRKPVNMIKILHSLWRERKGILDILKDNQTKRHRWYVSVCNIKSINIWIYIRERESMSGFIMQSVLLLWFLFNKMFIPLDTK